MIGATASVIELGLLRVLVEWLTWPLTVATVVAAEVLMLGKFFVIDRWVFGYAWPAVGRLARFQGAQISALVVYWLVINGLNELLGLPYVAGFILGTGAAFAWSLLTNFLWVWARPRRAADRNVDSAA